MNGQNVQNVRTDKNFGWGSHVVEPLYDGTINALGYLAGNYVSASLLNSSCNSGNQHEISYMDRVQAELANRAIQHGVRFLGRDVLKPALMKCFGLMSQNPPKDPGKLAASKVADFTVGLGMDLVGGGIATQLHTPSSGPLQLPENVHAGVNAMIYGATDAIGGGLKRVFQHFLGGERKVPDPNLKDLGITALQRSVTVVADGFTVSATKFNVPGMWPDNHCLHDSSGTFGHTTAVLTTLDGTESTIDALTTVGKKLATKDQPQDAQGGQGNGQVGGQADGHGDGNVVQVLPPPGDNQGGDVQEMQPMNLGHGHGNDVHVQVENQDAVDDAHDEQPPNNVGEHQAHVDANVDGHAVHHQEGIV